MTTESSRLTDSDPKPKSLDDFIILGRYTMAILVTAEFLCLACLSSMTFMMYAGVAPTVIGCGDIELNRTESCLLLPELRNQTNCLPKLSYQFRSVNVDFDRICADGHEVKNSISIQMFGVLVGAAVWGQASDLFGRTRSLFLSIVGLSLSALATAFSPSLGWFTVLRTINGIFTGGVASISTVFLTENVPKKHRMWIQTIITWSPNFIVYPVLAYYSHDWSTLSFVIGIVGVIASCCLYFIYESPQWLIQKGRISEARDILLKIRRVDRQDDPKTEEELETMLVYEQELFADRSSKAKNYTFYHLFCTWKMVFSTLCLLFGVFVAALITYAFLYNMESLSGSIYKNSAIFGASRWFVNIVVGIGDYYIPLLGRRIVHQAATICNVMALAGMGYYFWGTDIAEGGLLIRFGTLACMATCAQLFLAKYIITNELYPTAVRNLAVSALSTISRIGTIIAPQLFYLSDIDRSLPYLVLLAISVIDLVLFQVIVPETKGKTLENHLPSKDQRFNLLKKKSTVALPLNSA